MEDQEKNNKNKAFMSNRRAISLRLSYSPDLIHELGDAVNFVLEKIDFYPTQKFNPSPDLNEGLIELIGLDGDLLTLNIQLVERNAKFKHITFYTDDCLRDYHKYTLAGVEFVSRPEYTDYGLKVDFIGYAEARYSLLEERIYTDSTH